MYIQGCALRKISWSPSGFQAFYLSRPDLKVGRPNKYFGEPFGLPSIPAGVPRPPKLVARVHLMRKYFVQTRNFNFWIWQKPAFCLMKPIKVFVPFRFKTRNVSNAAELFRFQREKSKKFQQVYVNFIKIFGSNIGKLCFLPVILNLKINFQKVNQCGMRYNVTEFYMRLIELKFPWKIPWNSETATAPNLLF